MTVIDTPTRGAGAGSSGDPLGPVGGAGARLLAIVTELLAKPAVELDPVSSLLRTEAVLRARTMLRAVELDGVTDADTRELYALRQAGSVGTWLGGLPYAAGGGSRLALGRRLAASPAARAALAAGDLAPVAVERILTSVDGLPSRLVETVTAGLTGVPETPAGREVDPVEAADAAERFAAVLGDGIRDLIGVQPPAVTAAVDAALEALLAETPTTAGEVKEQLTTGLVLLARHVHPRHLRHCVEVLLDALAPPADLTDGDPAWDSRHLQLSDLLDGWGHVDGDLPPQVYRLLRSRLEAHVKAARARAAAQQAAADGTELDPAPGPDDETAPAGRRPTGREYADALADLLRDPSSQPAVGTDDDPDSDDDAQTGADDDRASAADGHADADVDAHAATGEDDETDLTAAAAGPAAPDAAEAEQLDLLDGQVPPGPAATRPARRCSSRRTWASLTPITIVVPAGRLARRAGALAARTADGHRVSDAALASAVCHAGLAALLTDPRGLDLDAAAHQRAASPAQRAALNAIWHGHCATHGCGRPGTVPHHVVPWHLHGLTIMSNLRPLCEGCHDDLHLGGRTLRLRDGTATCPTGWALPPPDL